jgi:hypothetical protein
LLITTLYHLPVVGVSTVIALRGEYFTAFLSGNRQLSFHFSFVHHLLGRGVDHHSPSNSYSSSAATGSIDAFVRVHCRHLTKLLLYREHLLRYCSTLIRRRRSTSRRAKESPPSSYSLRAVDSVSMTTTDGMFTALLSPSGSLTMAVRAMFHDRTMVKLDLALQVRKCISPLFIHLSGGAE